MIFLTIGTQFPFDRLVKAVDSAIDEGFIDEEVFAQIGGSLYKPCNFEYVQSLKKASFDNYVINASSVIAHAGVGTITAALDNNIPLLAMPRLKKYSEAVSDHQVAIAKRFEELRHILVAYEVDELPRKIKQLRTFMPRKRVTQSQEVAKRISLFLNKLVVNNKLRG